MRFRVANQIWITTRQMSRPAQGVYTISKHEANVLNIHVHGVCSNFASCLLLRVNIPI